MAVNERGVLRGESAVIVAPTASGKTMVGEMAAVRAVVHRGRAVFLVPTRALVNELYERFTETYGTRGLRVVRATGALSSDIPAIIKGRYALAVLTYETYAGLAQVHPGLLDQIGTLVVDEVQTIADDERGAALELLLTSVVSRKARRPQIVALSSGLGEHHSHLDTWLDAKALIWSERPQPLVEGVLDADGGFRSRDDGGAEADTELVVRQKYDAEFNAVESMIRQDLAAGRQVLVFRSSRRTAMNEAVHLAASLGLPRASSALATLPREDATRVRTALEQCLARGVAFHNADLSEATKRAVESAFRTQGSGIGVLVSTDTLAQGVNLPADVVIVRDLEYPRPGRPLAYTVAGYKNMVGRAGRRSEGRAVIPVESADAGEVWSTYVTGVPEAVRSSLLRSALDLDTLVLRAVAILSRVEHRVRVPHVHAFLNRSLAAHQSRVGDTPFRLSPLDVSAVCDTLFDLGLLLDPDELAVTPLGDVVSSGTLCVRSAVKSVAMLRSIDIDDVTGEALLAIAQCTGELDAVPVEHTIVWRQLIGHFEKYGLPRPIKDAIVNAPTAVGRAARTLICLTWTRLITMTELENALSPGIRRNPPAVPITPVLSRTRDVIGTVVRLARVVHRSARDDLGLLDFQLDHGVPVGLSEIASRAGGSLDRWDYQCLWRQNLCEPTLILGRTVDELTPVLGGDLVKAIRVLELATAVVDSEQSFARLSADIG